MPKGFWMVKMDLSERLESHFACDLEIKSFLALVLQNSPIFHQGMTMLAFGMESLEIRSLWGT